MRCREFEQMISLSLDGRLDAVSLKELQRHLDQCAACRDFYERLVSLNDHVKAVVMPLTTTELAEKVKQRIASVRERDRQHHWVLGWKPAPLLATVLIIGVAIGSLAGDSLSKLVVRDRHALQMELLATENGQSFSDAILEVSQTGNSR
jgi:predicted anti-sigma-YlaC factor YlaD